LKRIAHALKSNDFDTMKIELNISNFSVTLLQIIILCGTTLIIFFSKIAKAGLAESLVFTVINVIFYTIIIYGNILWLYPRFYESGKPIRYLVYSIGYVIVFALGRRCLALWIYDFYFTRKPEVTGIASILTFITSCFLDYLICLIIPLALAYYKIKQQLEETLLQKNQAELNLLKARLQPHFLFNTLNNIYYEIYTEAPRSATLIEQLSDIMRYFVDESPKDHVMLTAEIAFLENYVALESIRLRFRTDIRVEKRLSKDFAVPPLLFMTLAENIFKHGIDREKASNPITIKLYDLADNLYFETINPIANNSISCRGSGLKNLKERLRILYGESFELIGRAENNYFFATLKIPV
jgi:sensor histidine kinase YesM